MRTQRDLICINCPLGCPLTVTMEDGQVLSVTGNSCPRGEAYGRKECTNPTRIVTSTVRVEGGTLPVVSVKTASDIPKGRMQDCIRALKPITLKAPVHIGDVILSDAGGCGADVIATKNVPAREKGAENS